MIIVNKIDILKDTEEWKEIQSFINENTRKLLEITPELFPISAQRALQAKQGQPQKTNQYDEQQEANHIFKAARRSTASVSNS